MGASVIDIIDSAVTPYILTFDNIMKIIDEIKLDVHKVQNFKEASFNAKMRQMLLSNIQQINNLKSVFNAIAMDKDDDFEQKKMRDIGLGIILPEIRMRIAMATNIPMSRLFGEMNKGFSSGEDDLEIYANTIESSIRSKMRPFINNLLKFIGRNVFGDNRRIKFEFPTLRVLSPEKEAVVKTSIVQRLSMIKQSGAITNEDYISELKAQGIFMTNPKAVDDEIVISSQNFEKSLLGNGISYRKSLSL